MLVCRVLYTHEIGIALTKQNIFVVTGIYEKRGENGEKPKWEQIETGDSEYVICIYQCAIYT